MVVRRSVPLGRYPRQDTLNAMRMVHVRGRGFLAFLLILTLCVTAFAASDSQIAQRTGLSPDLFVQLTVNVGGEELAIFIVYINDRTFDSRISPNLRAELSQYLGKNALYVNPSVKAVVDTFDFSPDSFVIEQGGKTFTPRPDDWVEITPGFLSGRFEVNPAGPSYGSGSEGILVLGDRIDPSKPFSISYQGVKRTFNIAPAPASAPSSPASSTPQPVKIAPPPQVTTLTSTLTKGNFSREAVAELLGTDPNLVGTLEVTSRGEELRLLLVRLEEGVRQGRFSEDLLTSIDPLIGTGAVMVWAFSPTGADFSPWRFFVQQNGTNYVFFSAASFVGLTPGFLKARRIPAGTIAAGVIRLPKGVDRNAAFAVYYGTSKAVFSPLP